ncbi:MAG TPA: extracellular solute-binding protein [Rectinemataceae bacterium]|nr:extracellular solute-binding protein [Rectinemataceae bacterium]
MKRTLSALLCIAAFSLGAATAAAAQTKELTLLVDNQSNVIGLKAVAQAFTDKTGTKVTFDLRPGGAEGDNLVRTRLATGDMDDLSYYNSGSLFMALNPAKNFVDLTGETFMAPVIDSFKGVVSVDGRVYAAPAATIMGGGWYYNKAIYAKLGLKVPKTWAQLMSNLEKIKAAGIVPVEASYKDSWTAQILILADNYNVLAKNPSWAQDYTAHKAGFANTPSALRGFEKLYEIYKKGYINKDASATTYDLAIKALADGKAAHYPMLSFATAAIASLNPAKANDIGYFAQPSDDASVNGLTIWMPAGLAIYKASPNIEAAKAFLAFLLSPEGMAVNMAAVKPDGPWAVKGIKLPEDLQGATKDMLPYIDSGRTAPALEFLSPIKGPNLPQISVQTGLALKPPIEDAREYDQDVAKQAKQLGLSGW